MTRLYYVRDDSDIQYNRDLFVEAKTVRTAIALWRKYYECESDYWPQRVYRLPELTGQAKALEWNDAKGMSPVWPPHEKMKAV